jgi:hypothetical protein
MKIYHFVGGDLVQVQGSLEKYIAHHGGFGEMLKQLGWFESEDLEMVYTAWLPRNDAEVVDREGVLEEYAYVFQVEDLSSSMPWVVLLRNNPVEYLSFMRMVEPLFTRASFLSGAPDA